MLARKQLYLKYTISIIVAPLFCIIYVKLFGQSADNLFWIFDDLKYLFFLIILYPIVEELTFRGMIQSYISVKTKYFEFLWGISLANVLTSILFGLMHLIHHEPIWATLVFVPSVIFGYFKDRFDSVLPSIFLHMFYNLCFFSIIGN